MALELDPKEIADKYNRMRKIWTKEDRWHYYVYQVIKSYLHDCYKKYFFDSKLMLNAGSAGNDYCIPIQQMHVDIASKKIAHLENSICGSVCEMPFKDECFDVSTCVGSVLNYCDAALAIKELARVTKNGGIIVIEFETSRSIEYAGLSCFNKNVGIASTFYNGYREKIYIYNQNYIFNIIEANNLEIIHKKAFHIVSPWIYKLFKHENLAFHFSCLDPILAGIPIVNSFCANIILSCRKKFL